MSGFKFDPSQDGLRKTLKEYEELALRYLWELGEEGAGSGLRARGEEPFYGSFRRKKSLISPRNFFRDHFRFIPCKTVNNKVKKSPRTTFSGINKKPELLRKETIK